MRRILLALTITVATAPLTLTAQWQLQDAHTTADLRGIDNVGGGVTWASGSNGTILRTEDAGFVWQLCAKPPGGEHLDFRGVQGIDNNTAIIMSSGKGDLSRLYKTTDGCQTWKLLFTNPDPDGFWDALRFDSSRTGMVIGDPVKHNFPIFSTINAGDSWSRVDHMPTYALNTESMFAASNSTLLVEQDPHPHVELEILFLTGGGTSLLHTVQLFDRPIPLLGGTVMGSSSKNRLQTGATAGGFSFADRRQPAPELLIAVGGDYRHPEATALTAARCAWKDDALSSHFECESPDTFPHGYRSAVAYDPKSKTWITVGPNGTDISTDDGRNWRALHPDPRFNEAPDADQHWNALSLPFVVGPHGRIGTLRPSALKQP
jgi:hypothetical protein